MLGISITDGLSPVALPTIEIPYLPNIGNCGKREAPTTEEFSPESDIKISK